MSLRGRCISEGRFWTTTLPHHTPIPKLSSITKTRILFVFLPKKVPVFCLYFYKNEPVWRIRHTALSDFSLYPSIRQLLIDVAASHKSSPIFHVRLGGKSKSVSFSRVYVCVKAKLTLVFFMHLPPSAFRRFWHTIFEFGLMPFFASNFCLCYFMLFSNYDTIWVRNRLK